MRACPTRSSSTPTSKDTSVPLADTGVDGDTDAAVDADRDALGGGTYATGATVLPGDSLTVTGWTSPPGDAGAAAGELAIARYDAQGGLDGTFGQGGKRVVAIPGQTGFSTASQTQRSDGSLIVVGAATTTGPVTDLIHICP